MVNYGGVMNTYQLTIFTSGAQKVVMYQLLEKVLMNLTKLATSWGIGDIFFNCTHIRCHLVYLKYSEYINRMHTLSTHDIMLL